MKAVVMYELAEGGFPKAKEAFPGHRQRLVEFHARGQLLMAGPYSNPAEGALAVFTSKEAADEFVKGDPFVTGGAVGKVIVREWNESFLQVAS